MCPALDSLSSAAPGGTVPAMADNQHRFDEPPDHEVTRSRFTNLDPDRARNLFGARDARIAPPRPPGSHLARTNRADNSTQVFSD
jgi:hypothetical protein